jgi:Tol biopolymer transport system component
MRADGRLGRRLVAEGTGSWSWAPDSRRIVYGGDASALVVIEVRNARRHMLTGTDHASGPAWSPDGTQIAYSRGGAAYSISVRDGRSARLGAGISPAGALIAFLTRADAGRQAVVIARADGSQRHVVARAREIRSLVWAPDGSRLAWSDLAFGLHVARTDGRGGAQRVGLGQNPDWR